MAETASTLQGIEHRKHFSLFHQLNNVLKTQNCTLSKKNSQNSQNPILI